MHLKPVEGKILSDAVVKREEPGNEVGILLHSLVCINYG